MGCFFTRSQPQGLNRPQWRLNPLSLPMLLAVLIVGSVVVFYEYEVSSITEPRYETPTFRLAESAEEIRNKIPSSDLPIHGKIELNLKKGQNRQHLYSPETESIRPPPPPQAKHVGSLESDGQLHSGTGPYHNWELFAADYQVMMHQFKIFVYPHVFVNNGTSSTSADPFAGIFLPHPNPFDPKLGNYFSEHAFKAAFLRSPLITQIPEEAHFFFIPFSINAMRNDPRLHSAASISDFVAQHTTRISSQFKFWNASGGADHFYVCCHSIGRTAASRHRGLLNNAIQLTCSSSYFQRLYISHKDVPLPQVWPRQPEKILNLPDERRKLVFFAGRIQNSRVRQELLATFGNDTSLDIFSSHPSFPYEEGFRQSKYCLHVKGYEVNTARVSDAIHYGCIPVLISNYYELPFANVLDWSKFSIVIHEGDVALLRNILLSIPRKTYLNMYRNLGLVRKHFAWHKNPRNYDSFYMTVYQLWLRRGLHRLNP